MVIRCNCNCKVREFIYWVIVYLLTYILIGLSPSWEAANCATTQEFPNILRNPKDHYRVHRSPPLVPILSQIHPVHTIPSYLSKILLTWPTYLLHDLPSGSFVLAFPPISYMLISFVPVNSTCSTHLILFDLTILIMFVEEYKLGSSWLCSFLQTSVC
jgi:hypothetical protein